MRTLTKKDTPFLRKMLEHWQTILSFPFPLNHTQLITWAEQYPDEVIEKGLDVTAGWYERQSAPLHLSQAEAKRKVSLLDVASKVVKLEKRGGEWWGCCPFHSESTPSFAIKDKAGAGEVFFCQGCGKCGDVITFVEFYEGITTAEAFEAVKKLAVADEVILPSEQAIYRYASACMRNIARARTTAEKLLGSAR